MSQPTNRPATAQILDFAAARQRRAARAVTSPAARRQFLWSWPATGQVAVVNFPSQAAPTKSAASRSF
ncbi:MAG: hypothetical protein WDO56_22320 [Gammaproteobacteria bacterium]